MIGDALDRYRFPWLFAEPRRAPTRIERKVALGWTAGLKTAQEVATEVRTESSEEQERKVIGVLEAAGYAARSGGPIHFMDDLERGTFRHDETLVGGVKCDVPARLHDGRLLLIDCKVSNSGTNSVKRLNRECGGKASG